MKLTGLQIANFKAFGKLQKIPIRPITLIYGANSSGKSSIIHALALAHEANRTSNLDIHETAIGGESIDLGGFRQYVHRRETDRQVELGLEFEFGKKDRPQYIDPNKKILLESKIKSKKTTESPRPLVRLGNFRLLSDEDVVLTMNTIGKFSKNLLRIKPESKILHKIKPKGMRNTEFSKSIKEAYDRLIPKMRGHAQGIFPDIPPVPYPPGKERAQLIRRFFANRPLTQFIYEMETVFGVAMRNIIKFRYLGPLRSYLPRHFMSAKYHDAHWRAGGGYAWDVISQRDDVRKRINEWLGPVRLATPYELVPRELIARDQLEKILQAEIEKIGKNKHTKFSLQQIIDEGNLDTFDDPILRDLRSNTEVSHRDVGVGISQVLPVLVYAYASWGQLIAIEQPEIHLHPALQADLGDVFIESALREDKDARNTLLLETHSEHLLLRIMRRMRETCDGTLPESIPPVRPEDVMVLFVEPDGPQSVVREISLNERGDLLAAWPGGFFDEDLKEVLGEDSEEVL